MHQRSGINPVLLVRMETLIWESAPVQVTSEGLSLLSPAHCSALQGALGAWKLFLEDGTTKSRNGVAVPAATPAPGCRHWDPQQELLPPTPHFSPSKNSSRGLLTGYWLRRSPCARGSLDLTSKINHNILKTPHRRVPREVWDSSPNSTPTHCLCPDCPSPGMAAVLLSGAH